MKTRTALCDVAQVRESLLFISNGITRTYRDQWPAPCSHLAPVFACTTERQDLDAVLPRLR